MKTVTPIKFYELLDRDSLTVDYTECPIQFYFNGKPDEVYQVINNNHQPVSNLEFYNNMLDILNTESITDKWEKIKKEHIEIRQLNENTESETMSNNEMSPNVYISPVLIDGLIKDLETDLRLNDTAMKNFFERFKEVNDHDVSMLILSRIKSISTDTLSKWHLLNQLKRLGED